MSAVMQIPTINEDKMNTFLGKVGGDFGASLSSALVYIGQKLGLYKALADAGPQTPAELAQRTNTNERDKLFSRSPWWSILLESIDLVFLYIWHSVFFKNQLECRHAHHSNR